MNRTVPIFNNQNQQKGKYMKTLQSPVTLSEKPSTTEIPMPDYNWDTQTRHDTIVAGKHTSNSVQTFDAWGKPKDSQSDDND